MNVRFGVFADMHVDFIHDAKERFECFMEECEGQNVDFCVQLGDFCPPNGVNSEAKQYILDRISRSEIPFYHVLGNHDMDSNSKQEVLNSIGKSRNYISFDFGQIHFVILDSCYFQVNQDYIDYNCGNYKGITEEAKSAVVPPGELAWFKNDLQKTDYPTVIFSHHSLLESRSGIQNADEFRETIHDAPKGVLAAICGHEHVDRIEKKDGVWYMCVNSMSYYWAGSSYQHNTFSKEIVEKYDKLTKVFPYRDPLYAVVEVNTDGISVHGKQSVIVGATPKELHFKKRGLNDEITACIQDRYMQL